ncbi:putative protein serine/threonine kinase [Tieghemostelium lacteum]|uniref:non-specific serine/threonine protein kinase n=1 Tax=Tieghemostelium lacteum TaxID=361077 RepID=A0A151Z3F1_TIELA|nr:putative protein serine/threonine kinase [Tieghemostelium lacteum]|eukprot:KYQ88492.1 putative protein serine/threonine kinase [Tieghemostelium lacteum]
MSNFIYDSIDEYEVGNKIGEGKYGEVFVALHSKSNMHYCLKFIKFEDINHQESKILLELDHISIIKYISSFELKIENQNYFVIVLEYANGYSLRKNLDDRKKEETIITPQKLFTLEEIMIYFIQLLHGLKYIHGKNIIHRDIKPENILFHQQEGNPNGPHLVKIGDFGVSKFLKVGDATKTVTGTNLYFSPEIINGKNPKEPKTTNPYTHAVDIWALGIVLYEMVTLNTPFHSEREILFHKPNQIRKSFKGGKDLENLLSEMLSIYSRPSVDVILQYPFIKNFTHSNKFLIDLYNIRIIIPKTVEGNILINHKNHINQQPIQINHKEDDLEIDNKETTQIAQPTPPISIVPKSFKPLGPEKLIKELGLTKDEIDSADSTGMIIELIRLKLKDHKMKNIDKSKFVNTLQLHMEIFKSHNLK